MWDIRFKEIFLKQDPEKGLDVDVIWNDEQSVRYVLAQPLVSWKEVEATLEQMAEERRKCKQCNINICNEHQPMSFLLEPFLHHEDERMREVSRKKYGRNNHTQTNQRSKDKTQ